VNSLPLLAPLFLAFDLWQLFMGERYVGIKQIARGSDPREMGPGEPVAFLWTVGILTYALWSLLLLVNAPTRAEALGLVAITAVGYTVRRNCSIKLILVVMTFEGALRVGLLSTIAFMAWRKA